MASNKKSNFLSYRCKYCKIPLNISNLASQKQIFIAKKKRQKQLWNSAGTDLHENNSLLMFFI